MLSFAALSMPATVHFVSLGCPKNRVDTEVMLGHTADAGYEVVADPAAAEVIVVNTCGFIGEAKQESIDAILEMAQLQGGGQLPAAGGRRLPDPALPQGAGRGDAARSTTSWAPTRSAQVADAIAGRTERLHVAETPRYLYDDSQPRRPSMALHTAYVKIAEGCDRPCAFCIIPKLRGPQRSRAPESVVREAQDLVAAGARELCLVAQDLTTYGRDLPDGRDAEGPNLDGCWRCWRRWTACAGSACTTPTRRAVTDGLLRGDGPRAVGRQVPGRADPARRRRRAEVDAPGPRLAAWCTTWSSGCARRSRA